MSGEEMSGEETSQYIFEFPVYVKIVTGHSPGLSEELRRKKNQFIVLTILTKTTLRLEACELSYHGNLFYDTVILTVRIIRQQNISLAQTGGI